LSHNICVCLGLNFAIYLRFKCFVLQHLKWDIGKNVRIVPESKEKNGNNKRVRASYLSKPLFHIGFIIVLNPLSVLSVLSVLAQRVFRAER